MSVGQKYGIRNAGYYALRSLRIEKFFAFWGQDLNTLTTPMECGGESRVKLEKVLFFQIPLLCLSAEQCDLSKKIRSGKTGKCWHQVNHKEERRHCGMLIFLWNTLAYTSYCPECRGHWHRFFLSWLWSFINVPQVSHLTASFFSSNIFLTFKLCVCMCICVRCMHLSAVAKREHWVLYKNYIFLTSEISLQP